MLSQSYITKTKMPFLVIVVVLFMFNAKVALAKQESIESLFARIFIADPNAYTKIRKKIITRGPAAADFLIDYQNQKASWYERAIANALAFRIVSPDVYMRYQLEFDKWACYMGVPNWSDSSGQSSELVTTGRKAVPFLIEKLSFEPSRKIRDRTVVGWHWSQPQATAIVFLQHIGGKNAARAVAISVMNGVRVWHVRYGGNLSVVAKGRLGPYFYDQRKLSDSQLIGVMIPFLKQDDSLPLAAWVLGEFADPRAVEPLIESLVDYNIHRYGPSARALVKIGDPAVLPLLKTCVTAKSHKTRSWPKHALSKMGKLVSEIQHESLRNGTPLTRKEALISISILDGKDAVVKSLNDVWPGSVTDKKAIALLISCLTKSGVDVTVPLEDALAQAGDSAVPDLIKALSDPNRGIRSGAAGALRKIGTTSIPSLVKVLDEGPPIAHYHAVHALRFIGDRQAVPALINALENPDFNVVKVAATALGEIGDPTAKEPLLKALVYTSDWSKNVNALFGISGALAKFKEQRAFDTFTKLAKDENWLIRRAAIEALPDVGGEMALPILLELIKHENKSTRGDSAIALGKLRDPRAVTALIKALSDSERFVYSWAAWSLGEIGDPRALPYLRKMASEAKGNLIDTFNEAISKIEDSSSQSKIRRKSK